MEEIVNKLIEAKRAYYKGEPVMTDEEFDRLEDELRSIDPQNDYFDIVGAPVRGVKIKHNIRMRSMQKCNTLEHIESWYKRNNYPSDAGMVMQLKLDGLSGTAKYVNGRLQYIATRGDGTWGQDISRHIDKLNIPKTIDCVETLEIRGEFIIPVSSKLNTSEAPIRNITAGIINRKESEDSLKEVDFVAYDVVGKDFHLENEKELVFRKNKISFTEFNYLSDLKEVHEHYKYILRERSNLKYEIDGVILKPFDCEVQSRLEDGNDHHPVWATAWKFPPEGKWTTLKAIEWETSRLGNLIPVAVFEPIILGGSTVQKCSLSNHENVEKLGIGLGDKLYIEKANDIIPFLKDVERQSGYKTKWKPKCSCGNDKLVRDSVHLKCNEQFCESRVVKEITFWVTQIGMDNVSEATIRTLYKNRQVTSIKDLYDLKKESLLGIEGIGESKADNIIKELSRTKKMDIVEFINSLGIPNVGKKAVVKLEIKSIRDFLSFKDTTYAIGRSLIEWRDENISLIDDLIHVLEISDMSSSTSGIPVCATGKAPIVRSELVKILESKGYVWNDGVDKSIAFLLTDDLTSDSSKMKKARKLGIPIKTYKEFL